MLVNVMTLGYLLKLLALVVAEEPAFAGKYFDKSSFGAIKAGMTGIFPTEYQRDMDALWEVYRDSQNPANERRLEATLEELEARYPG
jgi:hypothetical protein